jgi:hypothetical protein
MPLFKKTGIELTEIRRILIKSRVMGAYDDHIQLLESQASMPYFNDLKPAPYEL